MRQQRAVALVDLDPMQGRDETPSGGGSEPTGRAVIDRAAGTVTASADVACPPERVYRMLVTAETERWWGSADFLEFDPPEKIVQTRRYEFDHPTLGRRETRVTYLCEPRGSGARVTVFHEGFDGFEAAAFEHALGWERVLSWLEPYARGVNEEQRRRQ